MAQKGPLHKKRKIGNQDDFDINGNQRWVPGGRSNQYTEVMKGKTKRPRKRK